MKTGLLAEHVFQTEPNMQRGVLGACHVRSTSSLHSAARQPRHWNCFPLEALSMTPEMARCVFLCMPVSYAMVFASFERRQPWQAQEARHP
eukprot:s1940_g6.t1